MCFVFKNGFNYIEAYRGLDVENWVYECWQEIKEKIDSEATNDR